MTGNCPQQALISQYLAVKPCTCTCTCTVNVKKVRVPNSGKSSDFCIDISRYNWSTRTVLYCTVCRIPDCFIICVCVLWPYRRCAVVRAANKCLSLCTAVSHISCQLCSRYKYTVYIVHIRYTGQNFRGPLLPGPAKYFQPIQ